MNEYTIGTMNVRWKKIKNTTRRLENVAFNSTDDLKAILKYHAIDECLLIQLRFNNVNRETMTNTS